jgi:acetolactate synthase I/II/III large subunit
MTTVARVIGKELAMAGIRNVFGLPGGETLDLLEGFRQEGLNFILTRHETSAAFMAATWGELTGTPGVCLTTLGPGATNLVTGVAHAHLDKCPVIALSPQLPADRFPLNPHQALELRSIFHLITKWTAAVTPGNAGHVIQKALRIAVDGQPGPVYLEIPSDVPKQEARPIAVAFPPGLGLTDQVRPVEFDRESLKGASEFLGRCRRPIVMVGTGALRQRASSEVQAFCEWLKSPVIDFPKAKGTFPERHPLFAGTWEMHGGDPLFRLIEESDLVLAIGVESVELDAPWKSSAPVLAYSGYPNNDWQFPCHCQVIGPIGQALNVSRILTRESRSTWTPDEIRSVTEKVISNITLPAQGLTPHTVLSILQKALPEDTIISTDTGAHKNYTGQFWRTNLPGSYLVSNGLSSMGFGLPAAIAAKLAFPHRTCVAVVGDGGFGMTLGEIETAVREQIPILCIVFVDTALGAIQLSQRRRGYPIFGTQFSRADYAGAAKALGADAVSVATAEECLSVFSSVAKIQRPTVVAVSINIEGYPR